MDVVRVFSTRYDFVCTLSSVQLPSKRAGNTIDKFISEASFLLAHAHHRQEEK